MYGLVDVDITEANRILASHDPPGSLTAFVVASVARAAAAHPEVHAYRNWRGQLVTHHHVDVGTMVEISTPQGPFAIPHLLRDADVRGVPELMAELRRVKREPLTSSSGRWLERAAPAATRIPGAIPAMYAVMARSVTARQRIGTVAVTAVGMFAGGGFGVTPLTLMSLEVIVGGMEPAPASRRWPSRDPGRIGPHPGDRPQGGRRSAGRPLRRSFPGTPRERCRDPATDLARGPLRLGGLSPVRDGPIAALPR